jgi:hypothetical protein
MFTSNPTSESVPEFNARMKRLEALACPTPQDVSFFNEVVASPEAQRMTSYRDALELVIRLRQGGAH